MKTRLTKSEMEIMEVLWDEGKALKDEAMATDAYRAKIAAGIADGVDAYFRRLQRQSLTEDAALAEKLAQRRKADADKVRARDAAAKIAAEAQEL